MNQLKTFFKKLTSVTLAAILACGMSFAVSAKSFDDVKAEHPYKEQVDLLSDIGVIVGTSEDEFSPENDVSREQMALFLFRIMLGRGNAGTVNSTSFKDLYDSTYYGAISWANAAGYIIGTSDSTFDPTGGITLQDAMTMAVRALGQSSKTMDGGYPWTYIDAAVKLGLDRGLEKVAYTAKLTRAQTAALLYNAFTAEMLIGKTSANGASYVEKSTIAQYVFGYKLDSGILTATNTFALGGADPVVKDGYVTFTLSNGTLMTVKFSATGLSGKADEWLGSAVRLVYSYDSESKSVEIIGASATSGSESFDKLTVASDNSYVTIGNVKYNIVANLSDALATNANELLLYVYDNSGKMTQVTSNQAVKQYLSLYNIAAIDDNDDGIAERALLKSYKFCKLSVTDGKINLADNLTEDKLTGGLINSVNAESGDYVLYYYNAGLKRLEIAEVLTASSSALVTRLTDSTATIGGSTYTLGNSAAGVAASDIRSKLAVGSKASVIAKNGIILSVPAADSVKTASKYLVALSSAMPVYSDGALKYIVKVNIGGNISDVITSTATASEGGVYRYTVDGNGVYVLRSTGALDFIQSAETADGFTASENMTVSRNNSAYFTLGDLKFVTDANTAILVKNGDSYEAVNGVYAGSIAIRKNASVTAVCSDNVGSVETLLFLYVSDGSLDATEVTTQYVKILKANGSEFADSKIYNVYEVYNYNTGKRETRSSLSTLEIGKAYALASDGRVTFVEKAAVTGVVSGYTASTVTVNGKTYALASDVSLSKINKDLTLTAVKLADACYREAEFIVTGGTVKAMIVSDTLSFTASYNAEAKQVVITPSTAFGTDSAEVKIVSVYRDQTMLDVSGWSVSAADNQLRIQLYYIDAGNYSITLDVNGQLYTVQLNLPAVTPAEVG